MDMDRDVSAEVTENEKDRDVNEGNSAGPPRIRYIDLGKHPIFAVHALSDRTRSPTFVIRQEYIEFMAHAINCAVPHERRFFLTGQPGIGKSSFLSFVFALMYCVSQARASELATLSFVYWRRDSQCSSFQTSIKCTTLMRPASSKPHSQQQT
jgi:hypothetical protein